MRRAVLLPGSSPNTESGVRFAGEVAEATLYFAFGERQFLLLERTRDSFKTTDPSLPRRRRPR